MLVGIAALLAVALAAGAWASSGGSKPSVEAVPVQPVRVAPPPAPVVVAVEKPAGPDPRLEEEAEALYREFEETALGLAGEGRVEGALGKLDAFPGRLRATRAGRNLEALRRTLVRR